MICGVVSYLFFYCLLSLHHQWEKSEEFSVGNNSDGKLEQFQSMNNYVLDKIKQLDGLVLPFNFD